MATLTETAYYTRRAINWLILAIIAYFILRISWSLILGTWLLIFPPKPPPPNNAFGVLPKLVFPEKPSPPEGFTFRLETIQGKVPAASESAAVYFMPKAAANLLALNRTQEFAARLGFNTNPIAETRNLYRFADDSYVLRTLRFDIVSNNFILRYRYEQDSGLFAQKNFGSAEALVGEAKSLLQLYDLYHDDIQSGTTKISFLRLVGDELTPTTSLSVADSVRIDFFRRAIDNTPIVTPNPDDGPINFIFSGSEDDKKQMLQLAYTYWPIDYQTAATYRLKTGAQAWQELQSGGGFIARYPVIGNAAVVRNIYVGYYDSYDPQTYLQPVFIFEGDNEFMGYVPAVSAPWVEQ